MAAIFRLSLTLTSRASRDGIVLGRRRRPTSKTSIHSCASDRMMNYATRIAATILAFLGIGGCAGMGPKDNARFQAVVAKNVSVGMPFVTAIEHLVKVGFSCDQTSSAPDVTCTRSSQSILPYSCVQRVDLATDAERRTIVEVMPRPIGCVGL